MGALAHVDKSEFHSLVLRRTFRDLKQPNAIMDRSHKWLDGTDAHWNAQDKRWTFPSGASCTFGYFDCERDKDQYASAEFSYIGFDELTQFPFGWYTFMFSRLRVNISSGIQPKMRGATNPGGIGHVWVFNRFVDPRTATAPFISATLDDNPYINQAQYLESLSKVDKITRDQLRDGIWRNDASGLVYNWDTSRNTEPNKIKCHHHVLGMDYGATRDKCAFSVLGWRNDSKVVHVLKSYAKAKMVPSESAEHAHELNEQYNFDAMIGDANGLGTAYVNEARRRYRLPIEAARKNDKSGFIKLFNGDLESGLIRVYSADCLMLIDEWSTLPWADEGRTEEAEGFDNHCSDATLYGWRKCTAFLLKGDNDKPGRIKSQFGKW